MSRFNHLARKNPEDSTLNLNDTVRSTQDDIQSNRERVEQPSTETKLDPVAATQARRYGGSVWASQIFRLVEPYGKKEECPSAGNRFAHQARNNRNTGGSNRERVGQPNVAQGLLSGKAIDITKTHTVSAD